MKAKPCIALMSIGITLSACQPTPSGNNPNSEHDQIDMASPLTIPTNENASIIVLDPSTGEPATNTETLDAGTAELLSPPVTMTPADQLQQIRSDDGTVTIVLDETYVSPLMATLDCNGEIRTNHAGHNVNLTEDCSADAKGDAK